MNDLLSPLERRRLVQQKGSNLRGATRQRGYADVGHGEPGVGAMTSDPGLYGGTEQGGSVEEIPIEEQIDFFDTVPGEGDTGA